MNDDAKGMKSIAHMILQRGNNTNKTILSCFMELVERGGVAWLQKRELVSVIELEGQGVEDAVAIIDPQSGRLIAFIGPDFCNRTSAGVDRRQRYSRTCGFV